MNFTEVSIEDISFKNPRESDIPGFGHLCPLKKKLGIFELPELKVYSKDISKDGEIEYIDLLLGRTDKPLYSFMNELDKRCLECIHENSADWYGEEVSLDILENYYKKSVRTEKGLPLLRVTVTDSIKLYNADDETFTRSDLVKQLGKSKMARVSVILDGLRIEENSICVNIVVDTLRTASSNKSLKKVKNDTVKEVETDTVKEVETDTVKEVENVAETETEEVEGSAVEVAKDDAVVKDETDVSNAEVDKEVVETAENVKAEEVVETAKTAEVAEDMVGNSDNTDVEENTIEEAGVVERNIELSREDDVASVSSRSSRSSRTSRHSRMSNRTAMSSQMSEQMDLVKRMHREAVKAERYANKKRMEAVQAVHRLRNLELAEMSSNYNAYDIDNASEFIETASYMDS